MPKTAPLRVCFSLQWVVGKEGHSSCAGLENSTFPAAVQSTSHIGRVNHNRGRFPPLTSHRSSSTEVTKDSEPTKRAVTPVSLRRARSCREHPRNRPGVPRSSGLSAAPTRRQHIGPLASKALKLQMAEAEDAPFPAPLTSTNRLAVHYPSTKSSHEDRDLGLSGHREDRADRITVLIADSD